MFSPWSQMLGDDVSGSQQGAPASAGNQQTSTGYKAS